MFGFGPSENDIQSKMRMIEQTRQSGGMMSPIDMDAAGQEALKRLLHGQQPQAGPQHAQAAPQGIGNDLPLSSTQGLAPQQADNTGGPPPAGSPRLTRPAAITPQQGGIWEEAEAQQRKRALAGVPTVR